MTSSSPGSDVQKKRGRRGVIVAVVVVVVVIIVLASVILIPTKTSTKSPSNYYSIYGPSVVLTGQPYNLTINSTGFKTLTTYFGDTTALTRNSNASGTARTTTEIQHTYTIPGSALIYITGEFKNNGLAFNTSSSLLPLTVSPAANYVSQNASLGIIDVNYSSSTSSLVNNQPIFKPGATVNFTTGYFTEPVNHAYQIIGQNVTFLKYSSPIASRSVHFVWNAASGAYAPAAASQTFSETFSGQGLYVVEINTTTALITNKTSGAYAASSEITTTAFLDVAIFVNGGLVQKSSASGVFTIDEYVQGGYESLDPAIAFDTVSLEPIYNTMLPLVGFNGSSDTQFVPMLAKELPSVSNGGINDNYVNYTVKDPWGTSYTVHVAPYQNYTFYINNNSKWQNGQSVSAWDVFYSYVRVLLFDAGSPLTGGWMIAPDLLPSPYTQTNTFWNITQNITVNNATNSITFHLQQSMTPVSLYGL
ncbi:MAG: hypothetical protein QXP70_05815, partial [Methanomassiliicoccales archaeon]